MPLYPNGCEYVVYYRSLFEDYNAPLADCLAGCSDQPDAYTFDGPVAAAEFILNRVKETGLPITQYSIVRTGTPTNVAAPKRACLLHDLKHAAYDGAMQYASNPEYFEKYANLYIQLSYLGLDRLDEATLVAERSAA